MSYTQNVAGSNSSSSSKHGSEPSPLFDKASLHSSSTSLSSYHSVSAPTCYSEVQFPISHSTLTKLAYPIDLRFSMASQVQHGILEQLAFGPGIMKVVINSGSWSKAIYSSSHYGIMHKDVLNGIYSIFNEFLSQEEISSLSPITIKQMYHFFGQRTCQNPNDAKQGFKRIDSLLGHTRVRGITCHPNDRSMWSICMDFRVL